MLELTDKVSVNTTVDTFFASGITGNCRYLCFKNVSPMDICLFFFMFHFSYFSNLSLGQSHKTVKETGNFFLRLYYTSRVSMKYTEKRKRKIMFLNIFFFRILLDLWLVVCRFFLFFNFFH